MGKGFNDTEMKIEPKVSKRMKINKLIQKVKNKKSNKEHKKSSAMIDENKEKESQATQKLKNKIKSNIKKKRLIKSNPELFQEFQQRFEKESVKVLSEGNMSKGQKKRFKRKVSFSGYQRLMLSKRKTFQSFWLSRSRRRPPKASLT